MLHGSKPTDAGPARCESLTLTRLQSLRPEQGKTPMKLALQSSMVFFGTLLAAALVALGEPASAEVQMAQPGPVDSVLVGFLGN